MMYLEVCQTTRDKNGKMVNMVYIPHILVGYVVTILCDT